MMVVKLNMILITSPELSEFRKRLKSIESKVCGDPKAFCRSKTHEAFLVRMVKHCSSRYTSPGVIMLSRRSPCVY
jgi:hypothetical protein